jgi:protoporphyrinogen oxidase
LDLGHAHYPYGRIAAIQYRSQVHTVKKIVVIGAGPSGLAAAHELGKSGHTPLLLEASDQVGGISRTEEYHGYRFDLGGHRFFTKQPDVLALWQDLLGDDLLEVKRISRIFYRDRFIGYPLKIEEIIRKLGMTQSLLILVSYLRTFCLGSSQDSTYEQWIVNRFGRRLFETFFKDYTEKVWGISCSTIEPEWAEQRIANLSFVTAISNAIFGNREARTLIKTFLYPRLGPGMMWQRLVERIEGIGSRVLLESPVLQVNHDGKGVITSVLYRSGEYIEEAAVEECISSMPITTLIGVLVPAPPEAVRSAAERLKYRALLLVVLIIEGEDLFPDQWLYIHCPGVKVGRIQNYGNWSREMVPAEGTSSLGMEYFCDEGDEFWELPDDELVTLAGNELNQIGFSSSSGVISAKVIRVPKAYPVYELGYGKNLSIITDYLNGYTNLQNIGRNGTFRYNNMDHSMISGIRAARNVLGQSDEDLLLIDQTAYIEAAPSRSYTDE